MSRAVAPAVQRTDHAAKVLVVDDDRDLVSVLAFGLRDAGFEPLAAHNYATALRVFESEAPELAIVDIGLGTPDGLQLLKEIRRRSEMPVVLLTGRGSEDDKVRGLEMGADDYLTKPFGYRELLARVRAHLRRYDRDSTVSSTARIEVGPLALDAATHVAAKEGRALSLTVTEFRFLHHLMRHAGTVVGTNELLKEVWGQDDPASGEIVRVMLHRLRRKIEDDPARPHLLHTVPGVGVILKLRAFEGAT